MLHRLLTRLWIAILCFAALVSGPGISAGTNSPTQVKRYALTSAQGLRSHNVTVEPASLHGQSGLRVTMSDGVREAFSALSDEDRLRASEQGKTPEQLVVLDGLTFGDGVIEAEIAGMPQTEIFKDARGFVGIAFRLQEDLKTYDAFYLRPTNGRAVEQVRRNRAVQYISHPAWTWSRFRRESPGQYESYVDLVPGAWTKVRIEVQGEQARFFVHGATQPTLVVNDLKTGAHGRGSVALWLDIGTLAHFRNVVVTGK